MCSLLTQCQWHNYGDTCSHPEDSLEKHLKMSLKTLVPSAPLLNQQQLLPLFSVKLIIIIIFCWGNILTYKT